VPGHGAAGGAHGGHATPHGAPGHAPVPIDLNRENDMDQVLGAMQDSWHNRLKNIGAGSVNGGKIRSILHGTTTVLSGGILGSYGFSAKGSLNKELDRIVSARTGSDWNASLRLTDIVTLDSTKVHQLSEKIRVCEEMEEYIDTFVAANNLATAAASRVKRAPALEIAKARNYIGPLWALARSHPKTAVVGSLAVVGGGIAAASALFTVGVISGPVLMTIGRLMERYRGNVSPLDPTVKADASVLMNARNALSVIRADAEEKRASVLAKIENKYKNEIANYNRIKQLFEKLHEQVGDHTAHELIEEFGAAFNARDPRIALNTLANRLELLRNAHGHPVIPGASVAQFRRTMDRLVDRRFGIGSNYLDYHHALMNSIGTLEATGPDSIGALIHRLAQVNAIQSLRGRGISIFDGGSTHDFVIRNVREQSGLFSLALAPAGGGDIVTLDVTRDSRGFRLVQLCTLVPALSAIHAELDPKTEHDLRVNPATGHPDPAMVTLLNRAKTEKLTFAEYMQLLGAFVRFHPRTLQNMHAAKTDERRQNLPPDVTLTVQ